MLYNSFSILLHTLVIGTPKNNKEYEAFIKYYSDLHTTITDVKEIAPHCVSKKIILPRDMRKLLDTKDSSEQVSIILDRIMGPLEAGRPQGFYDLLDVMNQHGLQATQELAAEIKGSLASCVSSHVASVAM